MPILVFCLYTIKENPLLIPIIVTIIWLIIVNIKANKRIKTLEEKIKGQGN